MRMGAKGADKKVVVEETEDVDDLEKEALKEVASKARELEREDLWPWAVSTGVVIQKEIP